MPVFPPLPHSQSRRGGMELDLMTRVMRMVVDDSHAEIAVHNGNLDGQEDQKFGGVNEDGPDIEGQTSGDSPDASAYVQHGDAQHSESVGTGKNGIAGTPGGGDDDDGDDDDDQPPHDDRGGGGGPRGSPATAGGHIRVAPPSRVT